MKTQSSGFLIRSHTNRTVQPQKMARGLKFRIKIEDGLYYPCSENKGADQLCSYCAADLISCAVTAQLICIFVFAYAKSRFSQIIMLTHPCNIDPLKLHFYSVKLWCTGQYIIFLSLALKHRLWVLVSSLF